jgi:putative endonuclease
MAWHVYIIECSDKKLYSRITNDLRRRIQEHNGGYGCKYTQLRTPVRLIYAEETETKCSALRREAEIKEFSRSKKLALINGCHPSPRLPGAQD